MPLRVAQTVLAGARLAERACAPCKPITTEPAAELRAEDAAADRLARALTVANNRICADYARTGHGACVAAVWLESSHVSVAHLGDVRVYRRRGETIELLTSDHTLLRSYREAKPEMTEEEVENFPHRNVLVCALGIPDAVVEHRREPHLDRDELLLCTGGMGWDGDDTALRRVWLSNIQNPATSADAVSRLIASSFGGVSTALAVRLGDGPDRWRDPVVAVAVVAAGDDPAGGSAALPA